MENVVGLHKKSHATCAWLLFRLLFCLPYRSDTLFQVFYFRYSEIAIAAFLPAPMALITVLGPVTVSPPA